MGFEGSHAHVDEPRIGSLVAGRYRILAPLGEGGMGTVFLAEHTGISRKVAMKVLAANWANTPDVVRRFRAEARAVGSIGHANIVEVLDAAELPDGRPFIVMELLDGPTLYGVLQAETRLPWRRAVELIIPVAHALGAAHDMGIVHRDLKAENVMLVERGTTEVVKVLDFGIAADVTPGTNRATTPGLAVGTPIYMAPEQASGAQPTPAFDIYAAGVLLFELIDGAPPIFSDSPLDLLATKLRDKAPSIGSRVQGLPPALVEIVDACLAIDPAQRPSSAIELATMLEAILAAPQPTPTPPPPIVVVAPKPRALPITLAVASCVGLATWALWPAPQPAPRVATTRTTIDDPTPASIDAPAELAVAPTPAAVPKIEAPRVEPTPTPAAAIEPTPSKPTHAVKPLGKPTPPVPTTKPPEPLPAPAPAKPAITEPDPSDDEECKRMRREAEDARVAFDWHGVLRHTSRSSCWSKSVERTKLRVKANMELSRFSECVSLGEKIRDPEVMKWVQVCRLRLDREG
jgi:serine/threonine-protein kinase